MMGTTTKGHSLAGLVAAFMAANPALGEDGVVAAFTVLCAGWGMRLEQLAPTVARIVDEARMPAVAVLTWMLRTVEIGQAPAGLWLFVQLGRYAAERLHAAGLPPAPGDETKQGH